MKSEQLLLLNPKSSDKRQRCSPTALVFTGPLMWDSTCTGVILLLPSALMIPFLYLPVQKTQQESLIFPFSCLFFSPECSSPLIESVYIQRRIDAIIPHQINTTFDSCLCEGVLGFWCLLFEVYLQLWRHLYFVVLCKMSMWDYWFCFLNCIYIIYVVAGGTWIKNSNFTSYFCLVLC